MKKALILLAIATVVALTTTSVALAAGGRHGSMQQHRTQRNSGPQEPPDRQYFTLVGIISEITAAEDEDGRITSITSIAVEIHNGNRFVKEYAGDEDELTVEVADGAEYRRWTTSGCEPIDPANIETGDTTSIHGTVIEGVFMAERITVGVPLDCCTR